MNIFEQAVKGIITPEVEKTALKEGVSAGYIMEHFASGRIVIIKNTGRSIEPLAMGTGLSTKVNANIGSSPDLFDLENELKKLKAAVDAGADAVMDLSVGGDVADFRKKIISSCPLPLGTVPLYEVAVEMTAKGQSLMSMTIGDFLRVIRRQAEEGVDFMTIHSGITLESLKSLKSQKRILGIASRGGSILAEWMTKNAKENPLFTHYDEILDILREYNIVISLGDSLRPGAVHEANDRGQIHEMVILGDLARRAREKGVQAIIEGPGHMPLDTIAENVKIQKSLCDGAPYYVLGPLVTDIAPGYDHITSAIGGAIAAAAGVDFLCYVTPAEHLRLPDADDVHEGVIASRIAAHAGDIVKLGDRAIKRDNEISAARKARDWEKMFSLCIDEKKARKFREQNRSGSDDQCSMCGSFCSYKREY